MSRYKPFRVKVVATKEVHVFFEIDAASPSHATTLARGAFKASGFDAKGIVGSEDHGWKLMTKKGDPFAEEITDAPERHGLGEDK